MRFIAPSLLLTLALAIWLGQTVPASRPQPLEAEVAALRAENARLRAELEQTKAALAGKNNAATAATLPRSFTSMQDILVNSPADLRPQATAEWYKYTGVKFDAWWQSQLTGMSFDQTMSFESAYVAKSVAPQPGAEWNVFPITFGSKSFTYFGANHTWHVEIPSERVDEAGAKKWDAAKKGTLFRIKGTIATVTFAPDLTGSDPSKLPVYHVVLHLRDVEFLSPNAK